MIIFFSGFIVSGGQITKYEFQDEQKSDSWKDFPS